jgi:hypothetical protein
LDRGERDEVTGGWKGLPNEELHNLYTSTSKIIMNKSRRMRWVGHVAPVEEQRNSCKVLVRKLEGKTPLGKPRRGWVCNIRMDLGEIGWGGL